MGPVCTCVASAVNRENTMSNNATAFAAVDLGASGGKVSVGTFADGQFSLTEAFRFDNAAVNVWAHGEAGEPVEKAYWDDLALLANIVEGLRRAAAAAPAPLASIGIDTWGADAALLNRHGELLGPVHAYRDHRLDAVGEAMGREISRRELFDLSGIPPQPWYLLNQLFWLSRHRPERMGLIDTVLPIGSLMQYYLCGATSAEQSWMVVQQLCSIGTADYNDRLLAVAGVPRRLLPEIVPPGTTVGTLRSELAETTGLGPVKVQAVQMHDTASAYTAAPVDDPRRALVISSGTWSLVGKLVDEPLATDAVFEHGLANEGVRGDLRLLRNVMGTWPVQQLRQAWGRADGETLPWEQIVEMASSAAPLAAVVDVDDSALYNPADMEQAIRGQIARTGQADPPGRGGLLRAVYEGLALKVAAVNGLLEGATGEAHEGVHVVGGGARNGLLNQFIADATGLPVRAGPYEATSIGGICIQAVASGLFGTVADARRVVAASLPTETFTPAGGANWSGAVDRLGEISAD